jgi:hypothetical protein
MRARSRYRADLAAGCAGDNDRYAVDLDAAKFVALELRLGEDSGGVLRCRLPRRSVHPDTQAERQLTTNVGGKRGCNESGAREHPSRAPLAARTQD